MVLAVKEEGGRPKFGFIRCEASEVQLFFHVSELEPGLTPTPGCEVRPWYLIITPPAQPLPGYHPAARCPSYVAPIRVVITPRPAEAFPGYHPPGALRAPRRPAHQEGCGLAHRPVAPRRYP